MKYLIVFVLYLWREKDFFNSKLVNAVKVCSVILLRHIFILKPNYTWLKFVFFILFILFKNFIMYFWYSNIPFQYNTILISYNLTSFCLTSTFSLSNPISAPNNPIWISPNPILTQSNANKFWSLHFYLKGRLKNYKIFFFTKHLKVIAQKSN